MQKSSSSSNVQVGQLEVAPELAPHWGPKGRQAEDAPLAKMWRPAPGSAGLEVTATSHLPIPTETCGLPIPVESWECLASPG